MRKRSGRGEHLALECSNCRGARSLLILNGAGQLECRTCSKRRTLRQSERGLTWWEDYGGREHDRVMRLLGRGTAEESLRRARQRVEELLRADEDRMALLREKVRSALLHADGVANQPQPTRDETALELIAEGLAAGMGPAVGFIVADVCGVPLDPSDECGR